LNLCVNTCLERWNGNNHWAWMWLGH
jgi:hypothetical protein